MVRKKRPKKRKKKWIRKTMKYWIRKGMRSWLKLMEKDQAHYRGYYRRRRR